MGISVVEPLIWRSNRQLISTLKRCANRYCQFSWVFPSSEWHRGKASRADKYNYTVLIAECQDKAKLVFETERGQFRYHGLRRQM